MMGREQPVQGKLLYDGFRLAERVRANHPLRRIRQLVDFDFVYSAVKGCYGYNGNVSVPPPVILKLMFLLFYYDVASERELLETLPERLDWLWFLGYELDDRVPDHSVLSKARRRWGVGVFRELFARIVAQCVGLGLVDGQLVYGDSSLVDANAANDSIRLNARLQVICGGLERRLDDADETSSASETSQTEESSKTKENSKAKESRKASKAGATGDAAPATGPKYVSKTDPDAAVVSGRGGSRARYKTHRLVDHRHGVVTATEVTAGDVNEAHRLASLMDQHEALTGQTIRTVVADTKYGTIDNYLHCHDRNVIAHMPDMKQATAASGQKRDKFSDEAFRYDAEQDEYICPGGQRLTRKRFHQERQAYDYCGSKELCDQCPLRAQCTSGVQGRSIKRHVRQDELDRMRREAESWRAVLDLRRRQYLMEGSFADGANNHGLKRARWRGWERVTIQDYLIAAIQNIRIMIRCRYRRAGAGAGLPVPVIPRSGPDGLVSRQHDFTRDALAVVLGYLFWAWNRA